MPILFAVVSRQQPICWRTKPAAVKIYHFSDGTCRIVASIFANETDVLLDWIESNRENVVSYSFEQFIPADAWAYPSDEWTGAILLSDSCVSLSASNNFDPIFPPPCMGLVVEGSPLAVLTKPRGNCVMAKYERIVSTRLAEFLQSFAACDLREVTHNGLSIPGYCRLRPVATQTVLSIEYAHEVRCVACGSPITANYGIWLGNKIAKKIVCRNAVGVGHFAKQYPCIISIDVASQLVAEFRKGYGLNAIVNISSKSGIRMCEIIRRITSSSGVQI